MIKTPYVPDEEEIAPNEANTCMKPTPEQEQPLTPVDKAWLQEVERRRHQLKTGQRVGIPASEVFDSIRQELGWKR